MDSIRSIHAIRGCFSFGRTMDIPERDPLSPFEELLLTAIRELGPGAAGREVKAKAEELAQIKNVNLGRVYVTLATLEDDGCIYSWLGPGGPERGWRSKRHFRLQLRGERALQAAIDRRGPEPLAGHFHRPSRCRILWHWFSSRILRRLGNTPQSEIK